MTSRLASRTAWPVEFPAAAEIALRDEQARANVRLSQDTIQAKRARVVADTPDWEELRDAGAAIRERALRGLEGLLVQLEEMVVRAGGTVHWARDALDANGIVTAIVLATGAREVVKVKSLTTDEIGLNTALAAAGIEAIETDLAELICQLADERPVASARTGDPS